MATKQKPDTPDRCQKKLHSNDLTEGDLLHDRVYDELVEVLGKYVGCVYLRYPHQEEIQAYRHACGAEIWGKDDLREHAESCDEGNTEWWDSTDPDTLKKIERNGDIPFEVIDKPNVHTESCSYEWPLDGHRFDIYVPADER